MPVPKRIWDLDDPRRCHGVTNSGQCQNISIEDDNMCTIHRHAPAPIETGKDFLTQQFERRLRIECNEGEEIKLLRDNLMDLNAMIAFYRNKITDEGTFLSQASALSDLISQSEKVTSTFHRLSIKQGLLLARPALIRWGQAIVQSVSAKLKDKYEGWEDDVQDLANEVAAIIVSTKNEDGEEKV